MSRWTAGLMAASLILAAGPALAWREPGHETIALIAYKHLTSPAKARVDALLASDRDTLTKPDIASRATWADAWRVTHRETAAWHFNDMDIDHPDLAAACFGFPAMPPGHVASEGPADDCAANKIAQFAQELRDPATPQAERLLALKFVLHLVGDMHQPLHGSDHQDKGGNCVALAPSPDGKVKTLHAYWDLTPVEAIGGTPAQMADKLDAQITGGELDAWVKGDPKTWAQEVFLIGKTDAYNLPVKPTCAAPGAVALSPYYQAQATSDAAHQIKVAGIRLAAVLNAALGF